MTDADGGAGGGRRYPVLVAVPRFADVTGNFSDSDLAQWGAVATGATLFGAAVGMCAGRHGRTQPSILSLTRTRAQPHRPCVAA
jgi:hypothetical protein